MEDTELLVPGDLKEFDIIEVTQHISVSRLAFWLREPQFDRVDSLKLFLSDSPERTLDS